jgi:signal transduction histidine kinase
MGMMTIPINGIRQPDLEAPDMNRSSAIDFEAATLTTFGGDASRPKLRARLARIGQMVVDPVRRGWAHCIAGLFPARAQTPKAPLSWRLVALIILLVIGTAAGLLFQDYQSVNAAGQQRARALAQIAAAHVEQSLKAIEISMQVLDRHPLSPDTDLAATQLDVERVLERLGKIVPALTNLQMFDAAGNPLLGRPEDVAGTQRFGTSATFSFHQDHSQEEIVLNRRDLKTTALQVSRRLSNPDGSFAGVIMGYMNPHSFDSFFAALGANAVELAFSDGTVLVRFPQYDPLDTGEPGARYMATHALRDMPLVLNVELDRRDFLAAWESKRNVAVALVCALIVLFVGAITVMRRHTANAIAMVALESRTRAETAARSRADELSRRKSDFLSQMSHELRTPLNAIIGFSEVIKEESFGAVGQPKYKEYADDIHYSAQHLLSVINNILDLSKVEAGKWHMAEDEITLDELFDALLRLSNERASRENVRLAMKPGLPGAVVRGDKRTLIQIMLNLTINAIKFAGPDRLVDLGVRSTEDGGIAISIADHGDGMTHEELAKAMKPFDGPTSQLNRKKQDTGLGLPLAAAFAELHGGKVELKSVPGFGTTAILVLPPARVRLAP